MTGSLTALKQKNRDFWTDFVVNSCGVCDDFVWTKCFTIFDQGSGIQLWKVTHKNLVQGLPMAILTRLSANESSPMAISIRVSARYRPNNKKQNILYKFFSKPKNHISAQSLVLKYLFLFHATKIRLISRLSAQSYICFCSSMIELTISVFFFWTKTKFLSVKSRFAFLLFLRKYPEWDVHFYSFFRCCIVGILVFEHDTVSLSV